MNAQSTLKVLLIEENLVNQKVTLYQLKSLGYVTDVVSDQQAALEKIAATQYDIILMNCQTSNGDGYETAQAIRQLESDLKHDRQSPMVIIAMQADLTPANQDYGRAVGINNYLNKPVRKEELAQELQLWQQRITSGETAKIDSQNFGSDSQVESKQAGLNQLIDWSHLRQMSDGNQDFELELLKIFLEDTQYHLAEAKAAISLEDFWKLEQAAHHVKGASANVGVKTMQMAAAQLEQKARDRQLIGMAGLIDEIESPLAKIEAFLAGKVW